jgi:hypothetical protein
MTEQNSRFSSLRELRQERKHSTVPDQVDSVPNLPSHTLVKEETLAKLNVVQTEKADGDSKRPPGRPPGRRSNPDYTQITAYIPLEILLEVQEVLAQDRRGSKTRTARPVSDLVEELLTEWLKARTSKNLKS